MNRGKGGKSAGDLAKIWDLKGFCADVRVLFEEEGKTVQQNHEFRQGTAVSKMNILVHVYCIYNYQSAGSFFSRSR